MATAVQDRDAKSLKGQRQPLEAARRPFIVMTSCAIDTNSTGGQITCNLDPEAERLPTSLVALRAY